MLLLHNLRVYFITGLVLVLLVQGCGFSPVYKQGQSVNVDLSSVKVQEISFGRAGQVLQTKLENLLNPKRAATDTKYRLSIQMKKRRDALGIERTREITRYNLTVTASYALKDTQTGEVVHKGQSQITSGYDAVASDFATYTVEEDTLLRVMEEIAKDIRFQLAGKFLDNNTQ